MIITCLNRLYLYTVYAAAVMAERRRTSRLFMRFFVFAMSASMTCSRPFPYYNTVQHIVENNLLPGYIGHGSAKNILKSTIRSTAVEQPLHLTRRTSSSRNHQQPGDVLLRLVADCIDGENQRQRRRVEENLPAVVTKHRVKYASDDQQLLSTSDDSEGPCSVSADAPSEPQNVPGQSLPAFNPTGW